MTKSVIHRVPGCNDTRKSPRVYTHAIVAVRDGARSGAAWAAHAEYALRDEYKWAVGAASYNAPNYAWHERPAKDQDRIIGIIRAGIGGLERRIVEARAAEFAKAEKAEAAGPVVLQWSMSERAAVAKVGFWQKCNWKDVRVVEVVRG